METNGLEFNGGYANRTAINEQGKKVGTFTGYYFANIDGAVTWQVLTPQGEVLFYDGPLSAGTDMTTFYATKAQKELNTTLKRQRELMENLLVSAEFVRMLEKRGVDCTEYRAEIVGLYNRYINRRIAMNNYIIVEQAEQPTLLSPALEDIVNGKSISIAITTAIILTAIVVTAFASLAWYTFYNVGAEARSDCKKSEELNRILANVDEATKEQLYDYIDEYADSFYKDGVRRTRFGSVFSTIKTFALIGLGGYGLYWISAKSKNF